MRVHLLNTQVVQPHCDLKATRFKKGIKKSDGRQRYICADGCLQSLLQTCLEHVPTMPQQRGLLAFFSLLLQ